MSLLFGFAAVLFIINPLFAVAWVIIFAIYCIIDAVIGHIFRKEKPKIENEIDYGPDTPEKKAFRDQWYKERGLPTEDEIIAARKNH